MRIGLQEFIGGAESAVGRLCAAIAGDRAETLRGRQPGENRKQLSHQCSTHASAAHQDSLPARVATMTASMSVTTCRAAAVAATASIWIATSRSSLSR